MSAIRKQSGKGESQPPLALYDPADELERRYDRWLRKTGNPEAAATMVLATVQSSAHIATPRDRHDPSEAPLGNSEYLTVKQAAEKYNLGERTIYRMVEDGLQVTRAGRAIRIKPRDLAKRLADSETILR